MRFAVDGSETMRIDSSGNVGIGCTPAERLQVQGATDNGLTLTSSDTTTGAANTGPYIYGSVHTGSGGGERNIGNIAFLKENATTNNNAGYMKFSTRPAGGSVTERMRIDSSGNVGIGVTPSAWNAGFDNALQVGAGASLFSHSGLRAALTSNWYVGTTNGAATSNYITNGYATQYLQIDGEHIWYRAANNTSGANAAITGLRNMTLDASGNLYVATTGINPQTLTSGGGLVYAAEGSLRIAREATGATNPMLDINNTGVDDDMVTFRKDGAIIGSIGVSGGNNIYISGAATNHAGLTFATDAILPTRQGVLIDNVTDLGASSERFKDLYLSGGVQNVTASGVATSTFISAITGVTNGFQISADTSNQMTYDFNTGAGLKMRLDNSGNLLIGTASSVFTTTKLQVVSGTTQAAGFQQTGGASLATLVSHNTAASGTIYHVNFADGAGTIRGSITTNGSATTYGTASDYRLKTDAQPMTGASARVQELNPVNFEWIADGTRVDGFLAHEAQAVVPEAVTGTKDAMMDEEYEVTPAVLDDDGNVTTEAVMGTRSVPDMQGIDQSKLVPLLTAALQEALTRIETLEAAVTALQGD